MPSKICIEVLSPMMTRAKKKRMAQKEAPGNNEMTWEKATNARPGPSMNCGFFSFRMLLNGNQRQGEVVTWLAPLPSANQSSRGLEVAAIKEACTFAAFNISTGRKSPS